MQYKYLASQPDGKIVEGEMEAKDVAAVLDFLAKQGFRPINLQPVEKNNFFTRIFQTKINLTDQIFLSKYLALMLRIGTGLLQAINVLITDFDKPAIKALLLEIRANVERGLPLYSTFARYPKIFSQVYINLVKTGEASGNLDRVFEDVTELLSKQKDLRDQIKSALTYPVILLVGSLAILFFLTTYALPKIAGVFSQSGFQMPVFSRIVFGVGLFMGQHIFLIFGILAVVIMLIVYLAKTSKIFSSIMSELPVVRDLFKKIALQRFAATMTSLIKAGLPMTEALEITAQAVSNVELQAALERISREGLAKGLTIGDAFRKEVYFPRVVVNLVAISEKAGRIEEVLAVLSDFYIKEIDSNLKTLVSFLEPFLLIFIGGIIGLIAVSVIIPIYQLTTQF
ncbi:MAG: type II secretion system F family protein [bacterium]|nr:type II secretion system F family protein [bacterium]